jgi:DNA modification methylase
LKNRTAILPIPCYQQCLLSEVYLEDCVKALKRYADNHFDLAIVDPPYGIKRDGTKDKKPTNGGS